MLNVIVLAGNVVADPETRTTSTGKSVSTVRLAVNNPMNDEEVLYINIDVWDKQSEFVQKFVKKGSSVSTQGRLRQREWTDNNGVKRTSYSVVADRINFLGSKRKEVEPILSVKDSDGNTILQVNDPKKVAAAARAATSAVAVEDDIPFN